MKGHRPELKEDTHRRLDVDFIRARRDAGVPDAAIARMGGWCVADVVAIPRSGLAAVVRLKARREPLDAMEVPEVANLLRHIAEQYSVTIAEILGPSRRAEHVEPRHEAMAVVWEMNCFTLRELMEMFRKTDCAITYGLRKHYERLRAGASRA